MCIKTLANTISTHTKKSCVARPSSELETSPVATANAINAPCQNVRKMTAFTNINFSRTVLKTQTATRTVYSSSNTPRPLVATLSRTPTRSEATLSLACYFARFPGLRRTQNITRESYTPPNSRSNPERCLNPTNVSVASTPRTIIKRRLAPGI